MIPDSGLLFWATQYIPRLISLSPQDFRDSLCVAGGAFGPPVCGGSEG